MNEAADVLGVIVMTLQRWDQAGKDTLLRVFPERSTGFVVIKTNY